MALLRLMAFGLVLLPAFALAAEEHEKQGLPQLDAHTYPGQILWLAVTFVLLYLFASRVALPRLTRVLATRSERTEGQIAEAARMKDAAAQALADYEKAKAEARAKAQAEMNAAVQQALAEAGSREDKLVERLNQETKAAEGRIAQAKGEAVRNLGAAALEAIQLATQRLIGIALSPAEAERAIHAILSERRA
jgi:F-type H+-transporting ATPase subunit b